MEFTNAGKPIVCPLCHLTVGSHDVIYVIHEPAMLRWGDRLYAELSNQVVFAHRDCVTSAIPGLPQSPTVTALSEK